MSDHSRINETIPYTIRTNQIRLHYITLEQTHRKTDHRRLDSIHLGKAVIRPTFDKIRRTHTRSDHLRLESIYPLFFSDDRALYQENKAREESGVRLF